jgi:hypothetical protein
MCQELYLVSFPSFDGANSAQLSSVMFSTIAFCSVKVPPTRAKSPKFTSSRRNSCNDTPQTLEGRKNTAATSTRSHRHSIGSSKDANRVQCSPKSSVAAKTRAIKPNYLTQPFPVSWHFTSNLYLS